MNPIKENGKPIEGVGEIRGHPG